MTEYQADITHYSKEQVDVMASHLADVLSQLPDESPKLKRFLIFAGCPYYPFGGWRDFTGSVDTLEEVMLFVKSKISDPYERTWVNVRDTQDENPYGYWLGSADDEDDVLEYCVEEEKQNPPAS